LAAAADRTGVLQEACGPRAQRDELPRPPCKYRSFRGVACDQRAWQSAWSSRVEAESAPQLNRCKRLCLAMVHKRAGVAAPMHPAVERRLAAVSTASSAYR